MTKEELLQKANALPLLPGVYLMMDKEGKVIYVGKAKKLKNRVSQYFQTNASHNEKTKRMVLSVDRFDTIIVGSEFEALLLENSLIKRHMPRYNILLKDDKGFPFVRLSREAYPRFSIASRTAQDGAKYFGPFGGRNETRAAIDAVCAAYHLPTCSHSFPRDIGKERPCLNYHMGRCDGFCRGEPTAEEYRERIEQASELFEGHYRPLSNKIRAQMTAEAEQMHFEKAAVLRDRLRAVEALGKKQKVIAGLCADSDVWGVFCGGAKSGFAVLHIAEGTIASRDLQLFSTFTEDDAAAILSAVLPQYYLCKNVLPHEILISCVCEGMEELEQALSEKAGRRVRIHVPLRGEKASLTEMANRNAKEEVERVTTAEEKEEKLLLRLAQMLSLPKAPHRMESFDISNTGASDIVASMVVFSGSKPQKSGYRRFQIKGISGAPDDYASMEEVLTRRIRRFLDGDAKFSPLPDVFFIDGGAMHAAVAERVTKEWNISVPVFGMVKDERHRTRALTTAQGDEIDLHADPAIFALIGRMQEETHRFAITYHRAKHSKNATHSKLDEIFGVGKARKALLRKAFGSEKKISEASLEELRKVLPTVAAQSVYDFYHSDAQNLTNKTK